MPVGTEHAFHVVGFLTESLVVWFHIKPSPLDHVVHVMAGYCWRGLAVTSALQCLQPQAFLLACARTLLMLLQGAWSVQNAYIMFSGEQGTACQDCRNANFIVIASAWVCSMQHCYGNSDRRQTHRDLASHSKNGRRLTPSLLALLLLPLHCTG
jgi:hypothetical protein